MGIPEYTRIIVLANDKTREYGIQRSLVVILILLAIVLVAALTVMMVNFAGKNDEILRIAKLEVELAEARRTVEGVEKLRDELARMQGFQERLLVMLGVPEAPQANPDSLARWLLKEPASAAEALRRSAALVLSPRPSQWPTVGFVTQEFIEGAVNRGITPHHGMDIAGPTGAPIRASGPGKVVRVGSEEFLGNFVEIQHGMQYVTVYGHCDRIAVQTDERVDAGQIIAYVGKSGQATAPHLHFEVYVQGEAIDPRKLLQGDPPTN